MKKITYLVVACVVAAFFLTACGEATPSAQVEAESTTQTSTAPADTEGFFTEEIPGSKLLRVFKEDADGNVIEDGFLQDGVKQGPWLTYERVFLYPKSLTHYDQGVVNGIYMEFTTSGQIALQAVYRNNKLHGPWSQYKGGRLQASAYYKEGELHGVYKEFMALLGRLQKEIHYKDGKQHGPYRYYNEDNQITMEYMYENGEKVSGGIVDPPRDPEPAEE